MTCLDLKGENKYQKEWINVNPEMTGSVWAEALERPVRTPKIGVLRRARRGSQWLWYHLVSLEKSTAQMADGIRFLSSSNFPCHLSCHIPSTEGNRPSVQSVLMSPWLQLRYNQQWDCQIAIHRTNATPHFNFKQGSGSRHIHTLRSL